LDQMPSDRALLDAAGLPMPDLFAGKVASFGERLRDGVQTMAAGKPAERYGRPATPRSPTTSGEASAGQRVQRAGSAEL
jgi:hypothetical protein